MNWGTAPLVGREIGYEAGVVLGERGPADRVACSPASNPDVGPWFWRAVQTSSGESQPRRRGRCLSACKWVPRPPTVVSYVSNAYVLDPQTPLRSLSQPPRRWRDRPAGSDETGRRATDLFGMPCPAVQNWSTSYA